MLTVVDDFGNLLHWTAWVKAWHALGVYSYADGYGMDVLLQHVDFYEVEGAK